MESPDIANIKLNMYNVFQIYTISVMWPGHPGISAWVMHPIQLTSNVHCLCEKRKLWSGAAAVTRKPVGTQHTWVKLNWKTCV